MCDMSLHIQNNIATCYKWLQNDNMSFHTILQNDYSLLTWVMYITLHYDFKWLKNNNLSLHPITKWLPYNGVDNYHLVHMESTILTFLAFSITKMKVLLTYMKDCLFIKMNMSWRYVQTFISISNLQRHGQKMCYVNYQFKPSNEFQMKSLHFMKCGTQ